MNRKNKNKENLRAVVLAAGKGKRLDSEEMQVPKVLRYAAGQPLLRHVLNSLDFMKPQDIMIVVGYQADMVRKTIGEEYSYVLQTEQLGTGHAVAQAKEWIAEKSGPILCCYGDMPLIRQTTYEAMYKEHCRTGAKCTILAYVTPLKLAYGRIIRDESGNFAEVVEDKDCTEEQKKIHEYNAGVYIFEAEELLAGLETLKNNNQQHEYYLTDIPGFIRQQGAKITIFKSKGEYEGLGVNTVSDLKLVDKILLEE